MADLSSKVDQSWWGGRLACVGDSLITYVIRKSLTCFISECAPHQLSATRELPAIMAPPTKAQPASYEADIHNAILALQQN
jgi:hypothetical protein